MRLSRPDALARLAAADHGILATVDPERGVTAVPACFALEGSRLAVPVETVKAKASTDLRRTRNLAADPRAALLCEGWDAVDWTRLWWVRADLRLVPTVAGDRLLEGLLRERYPRYREAAFERLLVFEVVDVAGWAAAVPVEAARDAEAAERGRSDPRGS